MLNLGDETDADDEEEEEEEAREEEEEEEEEDDDKEPVDEENAAITEEESSDGFEIDSEQNEIDEEINEVEGEQDGSFDDTDVNESELETSRNDGDLSYADDGEQEVDEVPPPLPSEDPESEDFPESVLGDEDDNSNQDEEVEIPEVELEVLSNPPTKLPTNAPTDPADEAKKLLNEISGGKALSEQSPEDIVASIMKMRQQRDERRQRSAANVAKISSSISSAFMTGGGSRDAGVQSKQVKKYGEQLMSTDECKRLAKKQVNYYVPHGQYFRIIKDKFFDEQRKFFQRFRGVSEMGNYLKAFVNSYDGKLDDKSFDISYVMMGTASDGTPIRGVKFGNPRRGRHVIIVGALKGCDWTSPIAMVHAAVALMGRHANMDVLLDAVQFHFFPIMNPSGLTYSRRKEPKSAKHWCKNRRNLGSAHGVGA